MARRRLLASQPASLRRCSNHRPISKTRHSSGRHESFPRIRWNSYLPASALLLAHPLPWRSLPTRRARSPHRATTPWSAGTMRLCNTAPRPCKLRRRCTEVHRWAAPKHTAAQREGWVGARRAKAVAAHSTARLGSTGRCSSDHRRESWLPAHQQGRTALLWGTPNHGTQWPGRARWRSMEQEGRQLDTPPLRARPATGGTPTSGRGQYSAARERQG